jgi:hypothetical protein
MKVFVLALDGLEIDYVRDWRLRNLQQEVYGQYEVEEKYWSWVEGRGAPYSPLVWGSFITGVEPKVHGITGFRKYRNPLMETLAHLFKRIPGKKRLLYRFGVHLNPDFQDKRFLKVPALFDVVKPSIGVDVIPYSVDAEARDYVSQSRTLKEFHNRTLEHFLDKWSRVQKLICNPWKLFMFYVSFTDHAGHVCGLGKLRDVYRRMDLLTYELKELLPEDIIFLIVSDHGMTQEVLRKEFGKMLHVHSSHGFWSLNFKTDWKPMDVTDFFPKILEWTEKS